MLIELITPIRFQDIPERLFLPNRPELSHFAVEIKLLHQEVDYKGDTVVLTTIYEPDLATFEENSENLRLHYYNIFNRNFWLEIVFTKSRGEYAGWKNKGDETLGLMAGVSWEAFFGKLSMMGLSDGEPYKEMMKMFGQARNGEPVTQERGLVKTPYFDFSEALKQAAAKQEEAALRWLREKYGGIFANERFKPKGE